MQQTTKWKPEDYAGTASVMPATWQEWASDKRPFPLEPTPMMVHPHVHKKTAAEIQAEMDEIYRQCEYCGRPIDKCGCGHY